MKKLLLSLAVLTVTLSAFAQTTPHRICGTMENLDRLKQLDPALDSRMQNIEQMTSDYIANHPSPDRSVITIPVVFHVIYNTAAQNISDAQCQYQIDQLNLDYARLNADASSTPAVWQSVSVNCNVQFCLAVRDPNGSATTGVIRKSTSTSSWSTNDNVKHSSSGGDDAWSSSSYLNIWSCNLGGGVLGYAQFPGGPSATDGVVFLYSSIGSVAHPGTATPYNLGRTATHEVGHWLNLYHIWGDDGGACSGTDNVSDTPNQGPENYGCPTFPHTDACSSGNGVMFMNYMDYTDDGCMNQFTAGQSARMAALFATGGSRNSIASSQGCVPVSTSGCNTPLSLSSSGVTTTGAILSWAAAANATSYNVQYRVVGTTTYTSTSNTSTSVTLSGLTSATNYEWNVQTICASGSSTVSSNATFLTQSVGGGCTDIYESNNTAATAKVIPVNTGITGLISTTSDIDWFYFNNTSAASKIKITMTNLPFDYDVKLYKSNGTTLIGTSQNGGTISETIIYNTTTVGTYKIKVYPYSGSSATSCYTLTASISGTNFRTMQDGGVVINPSETTLNLYPNPTSNKLTVDYNSLTNEAVMINVYDVLGRQVSSETTTANEGPNTYYQDFNNLDNGMYILEITNGNVSTVKRFMMEK